MTAPVLTVQDLTVTYRTGSLGRRRDLVAVDGLDLEVGHGETLGLVGESGSGKTTAGMAILRLVEPSSGRVRLGDTDITGATRRELRALRQRMQVVFQDPYSSLDPSMTIGQLLEEPLRIHHELERDERVDRTVEALQRVGLAADLRSRRPHEFSGGQRQRIAIARAMMLDPEFVVLDEPVSALDLSTQSQVVNLLLDVQADRGTAFLLIAHDLAVVRLASHRTAVMYLGQLVETGPSARVYDAPAHPYTAALNSAIPLPDPVRQRSRERILLAGDQPDPRQPPSGCRFRTRCPFAMDVCREVEPDPYPVEGGGTAACHLHTEGPALGGGPILPLLDTSPLG